MRDRGPLCSALQQGVPFEASLKSSLRETEGGRMRATADLTCDALLLLSTNLTGLFCNTSIDGIGTCWPRSSAGEVVSRPCPETFLGVRYNTTNERCTEKCLANGTVRRERELLPMSWKSSTECLANGTWAKKGNYSQCQEILNEELMLVQLMLVQPGELIDALHINLLRESQAEHRALSPEKYRSVGFRNSKNGRRIWWLRKKIGTHPLVYVVCGIDTADKNYDISMKKSKLHYHIAVIINYLGHCISLGALLVAFILFMRLRSIRCLRNIIHWNLITAFILRNATWFVVQLTMNPEVHESNVIWCRLVTAAYNYFHVTNFFWMFGEGCYLHTAIVLTYSTDKLRKWMFICIGWCIPFPIIVAWAIGKLYYDNEKKAVKATLVLLPLLGITYMLFFVNPGEDEISQIVFIYFNSFLESFQGFFVSVFYCFLNSEVRSAVRKRWHRWQDKHSIRARVARAMSIPTSPTRLTIHILCKTQG
ncbi:hypothetical protein cypCar_00004210 [Cyprinus carpio]|nr:hypothetical protein cypCar_00004210 [Cyprinus carpio]